MTSQLDEIASWLGGSTRLEKHVSQGSNTKTSTMFGYALADSVGGQVYVRISDDTMAYQYNESVGSGVYIPTTVDVKKGAQVIITLIGGNGAKQLIVTGVVSGRAKNIIAGRAVITPSASNTPTCLTVHFDAFDAQPRMFASAEFANIGTDLKGVSAYSTSKSSADIWLTASSTNPIAVNWMAVKDGGF